MRDGLLGCAGYLAQVLATIATFGAFVYGLVRFVHWAWYR